MESSLHRQLKQLYAEQAGAEIEVPLGNYRIDVVVGGELVEIQHGSLAAIRKKVGQLVRKHLVLVVKPLVVRKQLIKQDAKGGSVVSRRLSPKRGNLLDLFDELVYFTGVYPHRNLALEAPLIEVEEWRYPGHGRRRRWRENDFQVEDQKLVKVQQVHRFQTAADLTNLLPAKLPKTFHTQHMAKAMNIKRSVAQQIAYCLRNMGGIVEVGKQGNALLYNKIKPRKTRRKKKGGFRPLTAALSQ